MRGTAANSLSCMSHWRLRARASRSRTRVKAEEHVGDSQAPPRWGIRRGRQQALVPRPVVGRRAKGTHGCAGKHRDQDKARDYSHGTTCDAIGWRLDGSEGEGEEDLFDFGKAAARGAEARSRPNRPGLRYGNLSAQEPGCSSRPGAYVQVHACQRGIARAPRMMCGGKSQPIRLRASSVASNSGRPFWIGRIPASR